MNLGIQKAYDQASPATQLPLRPAGTVAFNLTLTNKGNMRALNPELTDVIDLTMFKAFDASLNTAGTTTGDQTMPFAWAPLGTQRQATSLPYVFL